jgi:N,N'-diacetyllegionaminate synthase
MSRKHPTTFKIGSRKVGDGQPCYIIAEAGSNHGNSYEQALKLIDVAADAGADAVKFQTFRAKTLYPKSDTPVAYLKELGIKKSAFELLKEFEMPRGWIPRLADYCRKKRVHFLSTPFDEELVDWLDPYIPAYKIASYEMTHAPLLQYAANKKKPLLLSTGGATLAEVKKAVTYVPAGAALGLFQCTARYPAPPESLNLNVVRAFREQFGVPAGLSDHSEDPVIAPTAAVALGAAFIEKHYTLSKKLPGPDHAFAIEPKGLAALVRHVRETEQALGSGYKAPHPVEKELRNYHRGVFTTCAIAAGERFTTQNTAVLRRAGKNGTGLEPADYPTVLKKKARRRLAAYSLLAKGALK